MNVAQWAWHINGHGPLEQGQVVKSTRIECTFFIRKKVIGK